MNILKAIRSLLEGSLEEAGYTIKDLENLPEFFCIVTKEHGVSVGITRRAMEYVKTRDPKLAAMIEKKRKDEEENEKQESKLNMGDWHQYKDPDSIMLAFPKSPTADDVLELWTYAAKISSLKLKLFVNKLKVA